MATGCGDERARISDPVLQHVGSEEELLAENLVLLLGPGDRRDGLVVNN